MFILRWAETNPDKETRINLFKQKSLGFSQQTCLTCFKACSSRLCLETESLHTVSQRVLSSCSCPFTHVVSSRLFSISSRPDRFSTWTVPVRFPSSFWKTFRRISMRNVLNPRSKTTQEVITEFNFLGEMQSCVFYAEGGRMKHKKN